jgi:hypothetical protein
MKKGARRLQRRRAPFFFLSFRAPYFSAFALTLTRPPSV